MNCVVFLYQKVDNKNLDSCIIVYDSSFREGIIGIVAGRLKSEFNRPTIVFAPSTKEGIIKASCRSIDAFHLKDNLDKIADIMIGYGGHAKAAGLSIRLEDFDLFKRSMLKMTDKIPVDSFIESIELDDVLTMNDITVENIEMLRLVEPYGESNQEPIFGLHLQYDAVKFMGEDDKHVKYWHRDSNVSVIEWNGGAKEKDRINSGKKRSKVIGSVSLNNFNGSLYPQFVIK